MIRSADQAAQLLRAGHDLVDKTAYLEVGGFSIAIRSNCTLLIDRMTKYFSHLIVNDRLPDVVVEAYDTNVLQLDVDWQEWRRERGKSGPKDAYYDLDDGRLLLKVRTGMIFLQSERLRIAVGPCMEMANQLINFINSQYMNELLRRGGLICHASGIRIGQSGVAIAGVSGGGKSTLMLSLMDYPNVHYVTNDRLLVKANSGKVIAQGIPKLPRVNPGTIVHNSRLHGLIDARRREQLLALPQQELWDLEEKYDVEIEQIYGPGRIESDMRLEIFVVLNWMHGSKESTHLLEVDLGSEQQSINAIIKLPGPFYQLKNGQMYQAATPPDTEAYIETLKSVRILDVRGQVDIAFLQQEIYRRVNE